MNRPPLRWISIPALVSLSLCACSLFPAPICTDWCALDDECYGPGDLDDCLDMCADAVEVTDAGCEEAIATYLACNADLRESLRCSDFNDNVYVEGGECSEDWIAFSDACDGQIDDSARSDGHLAAP